jgi:hypothetical protein
MGTVATAENTRYISPSQAAKALGMSTSTVYGVQMG